MFAGLKGVLRRSGLIDRAPFKGFLRDVRGVIHVGAHTGQERELYAQYRLKVLWIEPLRELFEQLHQNVAGYRQQQAVRCLVTDTDDGEYAFHITSNDGASSSIFELGQHKDIWPDVTSSGAVTLRSKTLPTLLAHEGIAASDWDALVMDAQGSELLVLKGAEPLLRTFKYVKTEVADFPAYEGGCQLAEIDDYLARFGFEELDRKPIATHPAGGAYYDIVYRRSESAPRVLPA